jgi:MerR family transcriptional regulator, mercuric resistance operon regulatory protein
MRGLLVMNQQYTIGQLARAAGVPTTTLRYYERVVLVHPTSRAQNQYRRYSEYTLPIIRFIRAAQAAGFTLTDVRTLLALYSGNLTLCKDVQPLIAKRSAEVSQRLEELRHIQCLLRSFLNRCRAQDQDTLCHVVDTLSGAASSCVATSP